MSEFTESIKQIPLERYKRDFPFGEKAWEYLLTIADNQEFIESDGTLMFCTKEGFFVLLRQKRRQSSKYISFFIENLPLKRDLKLCIG